MKSFVKPYPRCVDSTADETVARLLGETQGTRPGEKIPGGYLYFGQSGALKVEGLEEGVGFQTLFGGDGLS